MRKLLVAFVAALILAITLVAVAQEDDIAEYSNLDQLGHVIDSFLAGEEIEGLTIDAADDATSAIVRQFQITANLVSGPTLGEEGIEFVPVGFSEGSTTDLDHLEEFFDGTIGENGIVPPLAPWSRVGDEIDVSALFEGWSAYGDRGLIEGPIIINPSVQTIWGMATTRRLRPAERATPPKKTKTAVSPGARFSSPSFWWQPLPSTPSPGIVPRKTAHPRNRL